MRILITGAAGRIGTATFARLTACGHAVTGVDLRSSDRHPVQTVNLLDRAAVREVVTGQDAVVHLANNPSPHPKDPVQAFRDNVGININVFHSAAEAKVKKVIFASSVHAFNARTWVQPGQPTPQRPSEVPYLPGDGDFPGNPGNEYGLGKVVSEQMLAYYAKWDGIQGVSVRLPGTQSIERIRRTMREWEMVDELFSYLEVGDAARLFEAILAADLPGHRVYFPAGRGIARYPDVQQALASFFPHVPRRKDLSAATNLVDISRITAETGWTPEH